MSTWSKGLTSSILAALCTCTPEALPAMPSRPLTVQINLSFDHSITSNVIKAVTKNEAAAIWSEYGVDLQWTDQGIDTALRLDAVVTRSNHVDTIGSHWVLGKATIVPDSAAPAPIRISFDAIDALLEHFRGNTFYEYGLATALGRVLAHELGHVLLGAPGYHDPEGLMSAGFRADDLGRLERSRFRLTDRSVARLRARIASLSDASIGGTR